jgi:hypothetical protein
MTADDWHAAWLEWDPKRDGTGYSDVYRIAYHAGYLAAKADRDQQRRRDLTRSRGRNEPFLRSPAEAAARWAALKPWAPTLRPGQDPRAALLSIWPTPLRCPSN